ncbi:rhomboid family intramembrane serine protease [Streptomyces antimicrobicus]|uniref:Rhomboid family intramembrane serine protease n=1 Tax=Streptomyces antimicrobicus TaxID=2883108 RepID=A0ABS8B0K8_9ACTN|nr:rhomboid family intramembrane serine protease [Streptomyces antimicrobicus]MCB5178112.1 rhomboid family intramembrane serine protease [Streptomyces antimicrobicus]
MDSGAAAPDTGSRSARDPRLVTKALVALNTAVFLAVLAAPGLLRPGELLGRYAETLGGPVHGVATGEYHRLLTSVFLHQEWWHLASNMIGLWFLGGPLEAALGRARFLALYLLSGLGGSALAYVVTEPNVPTLGASGAVFGLLGALVVQMRAAREDLRPVAVLVAVLLLLSFLPRGGEGAWSVSWELHVGGLLTGVLIGAGMFRTGTASGRAGAGAAWGACGAVFVLVVAAVLMRTAELT